MYRIPHTSPKLSINYNSILIASLSYIYLPIFIFLFGFTKLYIALPVTIILSFGLKHLHTDYMKDSDSNSKCLYVSGYTMVAVLSILILFCFLCGYGGGCFPQSSDWNKHNAILHDLTEQAWPVYYVNANEHSMLTYYIAHYLFPSALGNIFHSYALTEIILYLWNLFGIIIVFLNLIYILDISDSKKVIFILLTMLFFSGALLLAQEVADAFYGQYMHTSELTSLAKTMWFQSDIFKLQYKSAFTSLRWTFHQWLVPCLMTTMFLRYKNQPQHFAILLLPMLLYASLSFLAFLPIVFGYAIYLIIKSKNKCETIKQIFSLENIIVLGFLGSILFFYLYGNILSEKPEHIAPYFVNYGKYFGCYIIFCFFMFGLHALLMHNRYRKNPVFHFTVATLCILPLFNIGKNNDLVLSGGTTGMFLIMYFLLDYLFHEKGNALIRLRKYILLLLLIIGIIGPLQELVYVINTNTSSPQVADNLKSLQTVANRYDSNIRDDYKYNYFSYDIENNIFYKYIARRKFQ